MSVAIQAEEGKRQHRKRLTKVSDDRRPDEHDSTGRGREKHTRETRSSSNSVEEHGIDIAKVIGNRSGKASEHA